MVKPVPYAAIRKDFQTGDIVLFSWRGGWRSTSTYLTFNRWTHLGMVVRSAEWDIVMLWEATDLVNIPDLGSGVGVPGVKIVPLTQRLATYPGQIAVRHLQVERTPEMMAALKAFRAEMRGKPFEKSKLEMFRSIFKWFFGRNKEDLSTIFCSEMVAAAWQRMGLLPMAPASNSYAPKDFTEDVELPFLKGARLGPEIRFEL